MPGLKGNRRWCWLITGTLLLLVLGYFTVSFYRSRAYQLTSHLDAHTFPFKTSEKESFVSQVDGFAINYPSSWKRTVIPGVATVLEEEGKVKVFIFAQPLNKIDATEYIEYSNRSLANGWCGIKVRDDRTVSINQITARRIDWERAPLSGEDLFLYREYHLILPDRVYTVMMKTRPEFFAHYAKELSDLVWGMRLFSPLPPPPLEDPQYCTRTVHLEGKDMVLHIPPGKTLWGILNPHKLGELDYFTKLLPLERDLGHKFEFLITYTSWETRFNQKELERIYRDGRIMLIAIQPWNYGQRGDTTLPDMIRGKYDAILRQWARQFKVLGGPVFVRFGNEMNGDWSTWCAWYTGKDPDLFIMAWKHLQNVFREEGADNVLFVFNPHDRSYPNFKWNHYLMYYPGHQYVDWIGLTGYNNGTSHKADIWRDFNTIYRPLYREYMHYFPGKPFMITEFSCNEVGGDKASWIKECFASLAKDYPNIKIAVWFNQDDGLWQYRINSSPGAYEAFKQGLRLPPYNFQAVSMRPQ